MKQQRLSTSAAIDAAMNGSVQLLTHRLFSELNLAVALTDGDTRRDAVLQQIWHVLDDALPESLDVVLLLDHCLRRLRRFRP